MWARGLCPGGRAGVPWPRARGPGRGARDLNGVRPRAEVEKEALRDAINQELQLLIGGAQHRLVWQDVGGTGTLPHV